MFGRTDAHTDTIIVLIFHLGRLCRDVSYDIWPWDERHKKSPWKKGLMYFPKARWNHYSRILEHAENHFQHNVFREFQGGGRIPGESIATRPQPKARRIDWYYFRPEKRYTKKPRQPPLLPQLVSLGLIAAITLIVIRLLSLLSPSLFSWGGEFIFLWRLSFL